MKPRSSNLDGVLLALEILKRIPRKRKITASELHQDILAAGFERDLRSIQRQLDTLSAHFDIDRDDRSKPFGYCWKENSVGLSIPGLNEKESVLLALAEQQMRNILPASLMLSMTGFFDQARYNLGLVEVSNSAKAWQKKVRVVSTTQPLLPPKLKPGVFETVSDALYSDHWLEVDYVNLNKEDKTAKVMPLGLAQQGARLYLVCRFEGYDDERSLALHRIQQARDTGFLFKRPKDFDLKQYDDDGRFGFGNGKKIKLTFRISKIYGEHIVESPLAADQQIKDHGDTYEISATVVDSDQLLWWLRGFGNELKVLHPKGLI